MQYHKYSLTELENMMPWERDIYTSLLEQYIEEQNLKRQHFFFTILRKLRLAVSGNSGGLREIRRKLAEKDPTCEAMVKKWRGHFPINGGTQLIW